MTCASVVVIGAVARGLESEMEPMGFNDAKIFGLSQVKEWRSH